MTSTTTLRSPRPRRLIRGIPLPLRRKVVPGCVPGSILTETGSSSVGTSVSVPSAASTKLTRSEEHTSELQSRQYLVCRLLLEKKKQPTQQIVFGFVVATGLLLVIVHVYAADIRHPGLFLRSDATADGLAWQVYPVLP